MTIKPPTPAQIAAAKLAPVPSLSAIVAANGDKMRVWNGKNFVVAPSETPYGTQFYAVPNSWETSAPVPPPTPVPVPTPTPTHPSGITPPAVAAGFTRALSEDFVADTMPTSFSGAYNGVSKAAQNGFFIGSHVVFKGDSLARFEIYPDPVNIKNCWEYTAAAAAAVNQWGGAGMQTGARFPVGTTFNWACKWDTYPCDTPIALTMGNWPPEMDIIEANVSKRGDAITAFTQSFHFNQGNNQEQITIDATDFSQWHQWTVEWTKTGATTYLDGVKVGFQEFSAQMIEDATYGLAAPQFLAFQIQTGDPDNPAADSSVTAENPITFYVDWVTVDVPA